MRQISHRLIADGWRVAADATAAVPTLRATNGTVDVEAVSGPGASVLTCASRVVPLAGADVEVLSTEVRAR